MHDTLQRTWIRKAAAICLAFHLLFYIGYQIYRANYTSVQTEIATYVEASDPGTSDLIQTTGTAVRKETVIQQQRDYLRHAGWRQGVKGRHHCGTVCDGAGRSSAGADR